MFRVPEWLDDPALKHRVATTWGHEQEIDGRTFTVGMLYHPEHPSRKVLRFLGVDPDDGYGGRVMLHMMDGEVPSTASHAQWTAIAGEELGWESAL